MANNLASNITRKLARIFLKKFESRRVVSKSVNTQLLQGRFNPSSGSTVDFKRPTDYRSHRTSGGDISGVTKSDIITGKATGTVQDYITVATEWDNVEEALELDQLDQLIEPMATRVATDLEVDFSSYAMKNAGLSVGTVGTAITAWEDVAHAGALLEATGVPSDAPWYYVMSPYSRINLAKAQIALSSGSNGLVDDAWKRAQITGDFGGLQAMSSTALGSYVTPTGADRTGAVNGAPDATYVTAKDTMTQAITVDGFQANLVVQAGDVVQITGPNRLNLSTRTVAQDESGAAIPFRATVVSDVTLNGSGAGTITIAGPAIFEANGQYNTVDQAIADNDVIQILGSASTTYKPNLFYHQDAFGIGSVKLPKLYSTDTVFTSKDGLSMRVSKYADGDTNKQKIRFDLLPAYATFNPFFAGTAWK